jgi:amidohydrolase
MSAAVEHLKQRVCAAVDRERAALIDLSRRIHAHPELCYAEHRASAWLSDYLERAGFAVERGAYELPTAFAARRGHGGPRVALLCEYDALPGLGHACGHNIIATASAGAGAALAEVLDECGGAVVVFGTPAEEGGGGKIMMAKRGAFADIDAAMMVHPAGIDLPAMNVLAVATISVTYRGKAAHASAFPHRGINALDALITAYNTIAQLRQHIRDSERIHGIITNGGQAPNIVPERAAGRFYIRAATEGRLEKLKERVLGCFRAGAEATGARLEYEWVGEQYSDMVTNAPLAAAYGENLRRLGRQLHDLRGVPASVSGSTDMGNVSKLVPAIHPMIAVSPPHVPLHSAEFAECAVSPDADRAVVDGAKALAMTALDLLCRREFLDEVRAAFDVHEPQR